MQVPNTLVAILALFACSALAVYGQRVGGQPALPIVELKLGEATVRAEIARSQQEQQVGLMHVTRLGDNDGMIFIKNPPSEVAFWMRNTLIPLTIAYVNKDGIIRELHDMKPRDETSVPSQSNDIAFVLEMNKHWFKMNGVRVGDQITPVGTSWQELAGSPAR